MLRQDGLQTRAAWSAAGLLAQRVTIATWLQGDSLSGIMVALDHLLPLSISRRVYCMCVKSGVYSMLLCIEMKGAKHAATRRPASV